MNMKLDEKNQLLAPLKVIDVDGNTAGTSLKASDALSTLEFAWELGSQTLRRPTRIELGEWHGELCWCDVRLNYGSVLPYLKVQ
jgi:hypothetical protein